MTESVPPNCDPDTGNGTLESLREAPLAERILRRYAVSPGVISTFAGLAGPSLSVNRLPLLDELQRRWTPETDTQAYSQLPLSRATGQELPPLNSETNAPLPPEPARPDKPQSGDSPILVQVRRQPAEQLIRAMRLATKPAVENGVSAMPSSQPGASALPLAHLAGRLPVKAIQREVSAANSVSEPEPLRTLPPYTSSLPLQLQSAPWPASSAAPLPVVQPMSVKKSPSEPLLIQRSSGMRTSNVPLTLARRVDANAESVPLVSSASPAPPGTGIVTRQVVQDGTTASQSPQVERRAPVPANPAGMSNPRLGEEELERIFTQFMRRLAVERERRGW